MNIIEETASSYHDIGVILLDDRYGHRVRNIEGSHGTPQDKVRAIYEEWLRRDEHHSWDTLCDCLRVCNLNTVAFEIEQRIGIVSPPISPPAAGK